MLITWYLYLVSRRFFIDHFVRISDQQLVRGGDLAVVHQRQHLRHLSQHLRDVLRRLQVARRRLSPGVGTVLALFPHALHHQLAKYTTAGPAMPPLPTRMEIPRVICLHRRAYDENSAILPVFVYIVASFLSCFIDIG